MTSVYLLVFTLAKLHTFVGFNYVANYVNGIPRFNSLIGPFTDIQNLYKYTGLAYIIGYCPLRVIQLSKQRQARTIRCLYRHNESRV